MAKYGYIITFRLDTSTKEGKETYNERLTKLQEYLKTVSEKYKEDVTTSTIYIKSNKLLSCDNNSGLVNEIVLKKFLHNNDIVKFHKFENLNLERIGYIEKNRYVLDKESLDILK